LRPSLTVVEAEEVAEAVEVVEVAEVVEVVEVVGVEVVVVGLEEAEVAAAVQEGVPEVAALVQAPAAVTARPESAFRMILALGIKSSGG